jgi:hypothetical protein
MTCDLGARGGQLRQQRLAAVVTFRLTEFLDWTYSHVFGHQGVKLLKTTSDSGFGWQSIVVG